MTDKPKYNMIDTSPTRVAGVLDRFMQIGMFSKVELDLVGDDNYPEATIRDLLLSIIANWKVCLHESPETSTNPNKIEDPDNSYPFSVIPDIARENLNNLLVNNRDLIENKLIPSLADNDNAQSSEGKTTTTHLSQLVQKSGIYYKDGRESGPFTGVVSYPVDLIDNGEQKDIVSELKDGKREGEWTITREISKEFDGDSYSYNFFPIKKTTFTDGKETDDDLIKKYYELMIEENSASSPVAKMQEVKNQNFPDKVYGVFDYLLHAQEDLYKKAKGFMPDFVTVPEDPENTRYKNYPSPKHSIFSERFNEIYKNPELRDLCEDLNNIPNTDAGSVSLVVSKIIIAFNAIEKVTITTSLNLEQLIKHLGDVHNQAIKDGTSNSRSTGPDQVSGQVNGLLKLLEHGIDSSHFNLVSLARLKARNITDVAKSAIGAPIYQPQNKQ